MSSKIDLYEYDLCYTEHVDYYERLLVSVHVLRCIALLRPNAHLAFLCHTSYRKQFNTYAGIYELYNKFGFTNIAYNTEFVRVNYWRLIHDRKFYWTKIPDSLLYIEHDEKIELSFYNNEINFEQWTWSWRSVVVTQYCKISGAIMTCCKLDDMRNDTKRKLIMATWSYEKKVAFYEFFKRIILQAKNRTSNGGVLIKPLFSPEDLQLYIKNYAF